MFVKSVVITELEHLEGLDECGCFGSILSISDRFANLLKSVILNVSISLYPFSQNSSL